MPKIHEENERIKRRYLTYLKEAKGQDEKSLDKVAAAIRRFEVSTGVKPFKRFHIDQAKRFKNHLSKARNARTNKPLSLTTVDATLRLVKAFFIWLAGQPGYKSRISYADPEYFNNTAKNARAAHAAHPKPHPSMEQAFRAFEAMPEQSDVELRDKALFAFFMLTGARDGAVASLRLKHINLEDRHVFQDGREVATKNAKTFDTWFFPVDPTYFGVFTRWVDHLRSVLHFGPEDPLFPKQNVKNAGGTFCADGFARETYSSASKFNAIIKQAFKLVQMPEYTPHSFRKTLTKYGDEVCSSMKELKAWSMNLGHEHIATTVGSYLPVSREGQREMLWRLTGTDDL